MSGWNRCSFGTVLAAACAANDPPADETGSSTTGDPTSGSSVTTSSSETSGSTTQGPGSDPTTSTSATSEDPTTSGCDPTNASDGSGGGSDDGDGESSSSEPECEPEWSTTCGLANRVAIELPAPSVPGIALLPAPEGGATFVWGHVEDDLNGLLRVDGDGQLVWSVETELRIVAAAGADDGTILVSGVTGELGFPYVRTLGMYASDGTLAWSRSEEDAAELEDAECPLVAHDPAVGWLVGCVVSGEFGGDDIFRLHTYDDDGALLATVPMVDARLERMAATGDGRVVVSGTVSGPTGYLASFAIDTGAAIWELETAESAAPQFAVGSPGVAMLDDGQLHGIDGDGGIVWSTSVATELECLLLGAHARVTATSTGFLVAGSQPFSDLTVVHHVAPDGTALCGDGPPTPTGITAASARVFVAEASEGGWVAGTDFAGPCVAGSLWLFRSSAP